MSNMGEKLGGLSLLPLRGAAVVMSELELDRSFDDLRQLVTVAGIKGQNKIH